MTKRVASKEFRCPGCQEEFDTKAHIPYVGSCADSLCGVCVNEKEINTCPVCNMEGAFAFKQKSNLLIEFLTMTAEDKAKNSKKAKLDEEEETKASDEPMSTLLNLKNRMYLPKIVKQLDPTSFLRLCPATTSLTCPNCAANFDPEIHIPYVGSCGDSICAVCINEKKTETCPVCNKKQVFTFKKKNNLAAKLLAMLTQDKTKDSKGVKLDEEQETNTSDEVVPTLLDPMNRMYLPMIVNQLDPKSFLRLSRCCKELHMICFDTRLSSSRLGMDISVMYDIALIEICSTVHQEIENTDFNYKNELAVRSSDERLQDLSAMVRLNMLKRYPFVYTLEKLEIYSEYIDLDSVRSFLSDLSIHSIAQIEHMGPVKNWNKLAKFVEDYHCKDFECHYGLTPRKSDYKSFDYVLHQTNSFVSNFNLPKQLLLEASVPKLEVRLTSFSKNTFMQLVKKFTNRADQIEWRINTKPVDLEVEDFIAYKLLPHDYTGPLPEERPLLFVKDDDLNQLWFLREDENVLGVFIHKRFADFRFVFRICAPNEYPRCLRRATV